MVHTPITRLVKERHRMDTAKEDQNQEAVASNTDENILGPNPVVGVSTRDILNTTASILRQMIAQPDVTTKHTTLWLSELVNILEGKSEVAPDGKDRRFQDPAWHESWLYKDMMQFY